MKVKLCLLALSVIFLVSANAQFRFGVQAAALKLPASAGNYPLTFGPGVDIAYSSDESNIEYFFNGSYFLPVKSTGTGFVYSGTDEAQVTVTQKTSLIGLELGARYFFTNRSENDFNFYATGNANLLLGNTTATFNNVPAGYAPAYDDGNSGKSSQLMVGLGVGMEYKISSGSIFAEAQFRFPASTYNSRTGYSDDVQVPAHPWFSAGYRFSFGGGSGY